MFDFNNIDKKWKSYWEENRTFKTDTKDFSKPKYYVLDMFPYPSGQGLHVGHIIGYTATDIVSRMKRMQGFNVLKSPCPFDGFTNRQRVKNLIVELEKDFPDLFCHLAAAMRKNSIGELWDAPKTRQEMRDTYFSFK